MQNQEIQPLMQFLDQSPSCYHAIFNLTARLEANGYTRLAESQDWALEPGGRYYVTRNQSSLIAFQVPRERPVGPALL